MSLSRRMCSFRRASRRSVLVPGVRPSPCDSPEDGAATGWQAPVTLPLPGRDATMTALLALLSNPLTRTIFGWVAVAAGAIALLFAAYNAVYSRGARHERTLWEIRIAREGVKNAKKSDDLAAIIDAQGTHYRAEREKRNAVEAKQAATIAVAPYPDCQVRAEVLNARNAIRDASGLPE